VRGLHGRQFKEVVWVGGFVYQLESEAKEDSYEESAVGFDDCSRGLFPRFRSRAESKTIQDCRDLPDSH
jgi:hypothetical protein